MHLLSIAGLLLSALPSPGSAQPFVARQASEEANVTSAVPRSYIIEYATVSFPTPRSPIQEGTVIAHACSQGSNKARRDVALAADIKVVKDFETDVFSGASIETDNHSVDSLLSLAGVVRAWPNKRVALSPVEGLSSIGDAAAAGNYTTHNATGVSKLHDRGIFGQGVKVGVVDSGTWYKHPAVCDLS